MSRRWYYAKGKIKYGPIPTEELMRLLDQKEIALSDMVLEEGDHKWLPVSSVVCGVAASLPGPFPQTVTAPSSTAGFWLLLGGNRHGPYTAEQLRAWLETGQVIVNTLTYSELNGAWAPLSLLFPDVRSDIQVATPVCQPSMTVTKAEEQEILEMEGRQLTKVRATVITDENSYSVKIPGEGDKSGMDRGPLMSETILRERKANQWKNTMVSNVPTATQKKELDLLDPIEDDDEFYPEGKVAPGHTWKVDGALLHKFGGQQMTVSSGEAKMTFERTTTIDGEPCAIIKATMNIKGKLLMDGNPDIEFSVAGTYYHSLTSGHDIESSMSGTMKSAKTEVINGQQVQMEISGPVTIETTAKLK